MYKKDAVKLFGSVRALAEFLGVTYQATSTWREIVPVKHACKIKNHAGKKIKFSIKHYA